MVLPVTGPGADAGRFALDGAKLALADVNKAGGVLGKPLELVTEDDQTTNPGAVLAFSKLASQPDIVAFIGSIRSTQNHAMAPDIAEDRPSPSASAAPTPTLTHLGNPWLVRFRPNDSATRPGSSPSSGSETLGKKKWARHPLDGRVRDGSGAKYLGEALGKAGATIALDQGYTNQSQDFTPVVLAIRQSGADVIGSYFTFENDLGIFARQAPPTRRHSSPGWARPRSPTTRRFKLAGPGALRHLRGRRLCRGRFEPRRQAPSATLYRDTYHLEADNQSSWTFDAVNCAGEGDQRGREDRSAARSARPSWRSKGMSTAPRGPMPLMPTVTGCMATTSCKNDRGRISFDETRRLYQD